MSTSTPILTGSNGSPWVATPRVGGYTTIGCTACSPIAPPPSYHASPSPPGPCCCDVVPERTLHTARSVCAIPWSTGGGNMRSATRRSCPSSLICPRSLLAEANLQRTEPSFAAGSGASGPHRLGAHGMGFLHRTGVPEEARLGRGVLSGGGRAPRVRLPVRGAVERAQDQRAGQEP